MSRYEEEYAVVNLEDAVCEVPNRLRNMGGFHVLCVIMGVSYVNKLSLSWFCVNMSCFTMIVSLYGYICT